MSRLGKAAWENAGRERHEGCFREGGSARVPLFEMSFQEPQTRQEMSEREPRKGQGVVVGEERLRLSSASFRRREKLFGGR